MGPRKLTAKEFEFYQWDDGTVKLIVWPAGYVAAGDEKSKPVRKQARKARKK